MHAVYTSAAQEHKSSPGTTPWNVVPQAQAKPHVALHFPMTEASDATNRDEQARRC